MMYEMLTSYRPFDGETEDELYDNVLNSEPPYEEDDLDPDL